jgi:hypothetical protein
VCCLRNERASFTRHELNFKFDDDEDDDDDAPQPDSFMQIIIQSAHFFLQNFTQAVPRNKCRLQLLAAPQIRKCKTKRKLHFL